MRQTRLLALLLVVLVLAVLYSLWATPRQERIAVRPQPARKGEAASQEKAAGGSAEGQRLRVDLLKPGLAKYPGYKRDVFGPLFPKPVAKPVEPPKIELPPPVPTPPPPPPPLPEMPTVREALARFTFLGFLLKEGERTIFLGKNDDIFLVRKGDRFGEQGRFAVLEITPEALTIRQGEAQNLITIPLVEKAPLAPSF